MSRLTGRFDGRAVVLDNPLAVALPPETQVEVVIVRVPGDTWIRIPHEARRQQALEEFRKASEEFWSRPLPPQASRTWKREDLYDDRI